MGYSLKHYIKAVFAALWILALLTLYDAHH